MSIRKYRNHKWLAFVLCFSLLFSNFGGFAYAISEVMTTDSGNATELILPEGTTSGTVYGNEDEGSPVETPATSKIGALAAETGILSMMDGTFDSTSDMMPATGHSPNKKTQARYVWYDGDNLYAAIVYSSDKPLKTLTFNNGMGGTAVFDATQIANMSWTGNTYGTPFYLNDKQYDLEAGLDKDSRWMVINLGERDIAGNFSLGLETAAGGFSTTLIVEIDSQLEVYHQYGPETTLLDEIQSGYLMGPSGGYFTFDVQPVSRTGFYLDSIKVTINDGTTTTLAPSDLMGGHLTGQIPDTTDTPKAVITFIYKGIVAGLNISNYSGVYDSVAHSILVNDLALEETVYYSLTNNGSDWSTTKPMFTNVTGETTVYVKVTRTGYDDRTGSGTVTITPVAVTINVANASKIYFTWHGGRDAKR